MCGKLLTLSTAVLIAVPCAFGGPDWTEIPDAGAITPQIIPFARQPRSIFGELIGLDADGGPDVADTYQLKLEQTAVIVISTNPIPFVARGSGGTFNSALFLFDITRRGVVANEDIANGVTGSRLWAYATDGTGVQIDGPGVYLLSISHFDVAPANPAGPIFAYGAGSIGARFQVSGPDGPGGTAPYQFFQGNITPHQPASYLIRIEPKAPCNGDANDDGEVDFRDITATLSGWQMCNAIP